MLGFWYDLLDTSDFPPRWRCGRWDAGLGWVHILSDLGVWVAYLAISVSIAGFARHRTGVPFRNLFWLFSAFIVLCGTTHMIEAVIFWWPVYRLSGFVKVATAVVSWATVLALIPVLPRAFAMRYPEELEREIAERRHAEAGLRASEARYRAVVDSARDAIVTTDRGGVVIGWNRWAEQIFGLPAAEALGANVCSIFADHTIDEVARGAAPAPGGSPGAADPTVSATGVRRDGTRFAVEMTVARWATDSDAFTTHIVRDVTERKRVDEQVARSELYYRTLFEHAHDPILVFEPVGERVLDVNAEACRVYGFTRDEFVGRSLADVSTDAEAGRRHLASVTDGRERHRFDTVQVRGDGRRIHLEVTAAVVAFDGGPAVMSINRDVTERLRVEQEAREAGARLRLALASAGMGTWEWEVGSDLLNWDARQQELFGFAPGEFDGRRTSSLLRVHPDDRDALRRVTADAAAGRGECDLEFRVVLPGGEERWVAGRGRSAPAAGGRPERVIGVNYDVTGRRRAEEGMRLRDRAIAAFVQGVAIADATRPDNPLVFVNLGFERMTGYTPDEVLGRNCRFLQGRLTDPAAVAKIRAGMLGGRPLFVELVNYRKDGTTFWNALSLAPVRDDAGRLTHFVAVQTDISPFKRLERQFLEAQKMEAVGHLAGGVAHDFNNLLTVINGYADMVLEGLPPAAPAAPLVAEILAAGHRAAGLTRQLLAFSRKQVLQPRTVDLNGLVAGVQNMLARVIGEDIQLTTTLHPRVGTVLVDPGQLEQVLLNLAVNARDAMPTGGRLTIETTPAELDAADDACQVDVRAGRYAEVAVADTGTGMTEEVKARLFEPFFTTKEVGKGTGLGLATVFGIVKQSGGHVAVYTEVGRGTTFKVYLPESPAGAADARTPPPPARPPGHETVLVVEDEGMVRALAAMALRQAGYEVLEAAGGEEARRVAAGRGRPIRLLLTDVVMPGASGRALADQLTAADPGLRVVFMSGYTNDAVVRHGILHDKVDFIQKPFTIDALLRKVRDVLDKS